MDERCAARHTFAGRPYFAVASALCARHQYRVPPSRRFPTGFILQALLCFSAVFMCKPNMPKLLVPMPLWPLSLKTATSHVAGELVLRLVANHTLPYDQDGECNWA